jgi:hypothetical protein
MADLTVPSIMLKELDNFLATKTCTDIDRTKFIPFDFNGKRDKKNNLTTCLVFNCNCHSYEDPTFIQCEYTGVVVHLPAFWLEVPKELAYTYISGILTDDLYGGIYKQWSISGKIGTSGSDTSSSTSSNCCCDADGWKLQ